MLTALLVDDDERLRGLLAGKLRREGFAVIEAGTGKDAIGRLQASGGIDVILLDLHMPDTMPDPYGIITRVKEVSSVPIIVTSGFDLDESPALALRMGIADFVRKPINSRELLARIYLRTHIAPIYEFLDDDTEPSKGTWRVDTIARSVQSPDGTQHCVPASAFDLLLQFLRSPHEPMESKDFGPAKVPPAQRVYLIRNLIGKDKVIYQGNRYRFCPRVMKRK